MLLLKKCTRSTHCAIATTSLMVWLFGCSTAGSYGEVNDDKSYDSDAIKILLPPNAPTIRRGFHPPDPDNNRRGPPAEHLGIDIVAAVGTPVIAPAKGRVERSFFEPMYGNHIVLNHGEDEAGLEVHTRFLHLQQRWVQAGDQVERGEQIGTLGNSGLLAGGIAHLHYELARYDPRMGRLTATDPNEYWVMGAGMVTCFNSAQRISNRPFKTTYPVVCKDPDQE